MGSIFKQGALESPTARLSKWYIGHWTQSATQIEIFELQSASVENSQGPTENIQNGPQGEWQSSGVLLFIFSGFLMPIIIKWSRDNLLKKNHAIPIQTARTIPSWPGLEEAQVVGIRRNERSDVVEEGLAGGLGREVRLELCPGRGHVLVFQYL